MQRKVRDPGGVQLREKGAGTYMNDSEDLRNGSSLLGELAIDRHVTALNMLAHAQKLMVVTHAGDLQLTLSLAYADHHF